MFSPKFQTEDGKQHYKGLQAVCGIICALYLAGCLVFLISGGAEHGIKMLLLMLALLALYTLPVMLAVVLIFHFFAYRVCKKDGCLSHRDEKLDGSLHLLSLVFAVWEVGCALFVLWGSQSNSDLFEDFNFGGFAASLMITLAAISLGALVLNELCQLILLKAKNGKGKRRAVRITALVLSCVILFIIFFVPYDVGTYSGGTKYYDALTYSVIDWHRVSEGYDPPEEQQTRFYPFPFNLLSYDAKWHWKH